MRLRLEPARSIVLLTACGSLLAAPKAASAEEGWTFGPRFEMKHEASGFELRLAGYVQGDLISRRNFTDGDDEEEGLNGTETRLRRARIGLEGEWRRLSFEATVDPSDEGEHLKDLFGEIKLARALRVRGGHFKVPVSAEHLTSASRTDFVERSMIATHLAPSRDWGVMVLGEPFRRFDYRIGFFQGDGAVDRARSDRTFAARIEYGVLKSLDLGASFSEGDVSADPESDEVDLVPRGLPGAGASQFRFYDPHFVQGRRRRLGADARWTGGPVSVSGEWLRATEDREGQGPVFEDLPAEIGEGWVGSATWLVAGDRKSRSVRPARPLSKGGPGAIQLGVRYERLRFDDEGDDAGFAGAGNRARNIRPAEASAWTGGLSWWPESSVRLLGNVVLERFEDALLAPEPGRRGNYVTILGRLQLQLP